MRLVLGNSGEPRAGLKAGSGAKSFSARRRSALVGAARRLERPPRRDARCRWASQTRGRKRRFYFGVIALAESRQAGKEARYRFRYSRRVARPAVGAPRPRRPRRQMDVWRRRPVVVARSDIRRRKARRRHLLPVEGRRDEVLGASGGDGPGALCVALYARAVS